MIQLNARATMGLIWHWVHFSSGIWTTLDFASDLVPPAFVTAAFRHLTNSLWDGVGILIWTKANTCFPFMPVLNGSGETDRISPYR